MSGYIPGIPGFEDCCFSGTAGCKFIRRLWLFAWESLPSKMGQVSMDVHSEYQGPEITAFQAQLGVSPCTGYSFLPGKFCLPRWDKYQWMYTRNPGVRRSLLFRHSGV